MLGISTEKSRADPYQVAASLHSIRQSLWSTAQCHYQKYPVAEIEITVPGQPPSRESYVEIDQGPLYPTDVVFEVSKYGFDLRYVVVHGWLGLFSTDGSNWQLLVAYKLSYNAEEMCSLNQSLFESLGCHKVTLFGPL
jgi:hypothetical protein